ncbi:STAS domain-containing protein [Marinobacter salinisoli]|uniref:Anti-sigma factor antagonist n=1 Tax=Marinobacter salinisoli TaxID=2769486 RepID=A0ABX7MNZ2_9GAMM|nr:STAS domain-containing protein [Marinobacter salinisoli]QSP93973.1 STAS domain-containing protein [Marinobacter salinisoli]
MANSSEVRKQLENRIKSGAHHLILNLEDVLFMDSSGLAVMVSAYKKTQPISGSIVLAGPAPSVRALLELTRLHEMFEIYADLDAALRDLAA